MTDRQDGEYEREARERFRLSRVDGAYYLEVYFANGWMQASDRMDVLRPVAEAWLDRIVETAAGMVRQRDQEHARPADIPTLMLYQDATDYGKWITDKCSDDPAYLLVTREFERAEAYARFRLSELLQAAKGCDSWEHPGGCASQTRRWNADDNLFEYPYDCDCGLAALRAVVERTRKVVGE